MNYTPDWVPAVAGAYLVGGCVRDLLLGRTPADYDVAVTDARTALKGTDLVVTAHATHLAVLKRVTAPRWYAQFSGEFRGF